MLLEAQDILNELENRLPYYEIKNGDIVYIGIDEYEVRAINDDIVELADTKFPLFTKELKRNEFDKKIKENPANDKLRTQKRLDDKEFKEESNIEDTKPKAVEKQPNIEDSIELQEEILKPKIQKKRRNRIEYFDLHPEIPLNERNNYHIENNLLGVGTTKQKFIRNIEAIKILKKCNEENRYATQEEQELLSEYVGWGGLQEAFNSTNESWSNEYKELKSLLTEKEYEEARQSTLTAFYTPPVVIRAIYKALGNMGLERGNILEPSCRYR
jgi:hypothetical protein